MPLVSTKKMLLTAMYERYAVGAFNVNNMEMVQAVVEAGVDEQAPVILQFSIGAIRYAGVGMIVGMVKAAASEVEIPVALHFDHGATYEQNVACIKSGFTSVMFDGSMLTFDENVAETNRICQVAHKQKIPVEAELGRVPAENASKKEVESLLTIPEQTKIFIEKTGADSLAVAIGSVHAQCAKKTGLDIYRLRQIKRIIPSIPLVLHGSSGVMEDCIREGIENGISKVNVGTCLIQSFTGAITNHVISNPEIIDPRKHFLPAREALKETVRNKIRLFGSNGKIKVKNRKSKYSCF